MHVYWLFFDEKRQEYSPTGCPSSNIEWCVCFYLLNKRKDYFETWSFKKTLLKSMQICFQLDCVWNKWVILMLTHRQQNPHQMLPTWPSLTTDHFLVKSGLLKRQLVCAVDGSEKFVYIWLQIEIWRRKLNQQRTQTTTQFWIFPHFS